MKGVIGENRLQHGFRRKPMALLDQGGRALDVLIEIVVSGKLSPATTLVFFAAPAGTG